MSTRKTKMRRHLLFGALGLGAVGAAGVLGWPLARPYLVNPCLSGLPPELADHPLVTAAWEGIDPERLWDCHVHLAGVGDGGSGIVISERMFSPLHPLAYLQRLFYLNAGCAQDAPGQVDQHYVARLVNLMAGMARGMKLMLFAFDHVHDALGRVQPAQSTFYVPNAYAQSVAAAHSTLFEWVCSVHPYRDDCVEALEAAVAGGARAVKWLPPAMAIDPASPLCDRFYAALARLDLPLISHGGEERAVHGPGSPGWANPLRLRRALDAGVRVVVAHCASAGEDVDLDHADAPSVPSFDLFARLMDSPDYAGRLFGDISAINLRDRDVAVVGEIIAREAWQHRLLYGSDYPLPGVLPLVSPARFADAGMLEHAAVPVLEHLREYSSILFDFVLKRHLHQDGRRFAVSVFHTRDFFASRHGAAESVT